MGCPDFILLYVPEVLSQKHFEKCSDCLGSRCSDLAIVHSLVQLAFGGSHKGGSGGSADDVGGSTSHVSNAGNGRKQDDGFHRQTGSSKQSGSSDGSRARHTDGTDGDDHSQHNEEGVLHRGVINAQQVDGKDSQQGGPDTGAARHTEVCTQTCTKGGDVLVDAQLLGQLVDRDRDGANTALRSEGDSAGGPDALEELDRIQLADDLDECALDHEGLNPQRT